MPPLGLQAGVQGGSGQRAHASPAWGAAHAGPGSRAGVCMLCCAALPASPTVS